MSKKFPLDLSKFKKTAEDDRYTTLTHDDGHSLRLAKGMLSPERQEQLQALKMASGGEVKMMAEGDTPEDAPAAFVPEQQIPVQSIMNAPQPQSSSSDGIQLSGQGGGLSVPELAQQSEVPAQVAPIPSQPQAEAPKAPASKEQPTPDLQHAYTTGQQAIEAQKNATISQSQAEAKALEAAKPQYKALDAIVDTHQRLSQEANNVLKEIEQQKIDPNHYMASQSTGQKIGKAISLILGGMSAGTLGGENPAVSYINRQIANDIDAQKHNMANKQNLFHAYNALMGNQRDAASMVQSILTQRTVNELKLAAAKAATPMAKAQALQAAAQLEQQNVGQFQQLAMRQALQRSQGGGISDVDPSSFIPYVVPEHHQAAAFKETERAANTRQNANGILDEFDKSAKNLSATDFIPGTLNAHQKAFHARLGPTFSDIEGTVRQAAMDNAYSNMTPQFGDSKATLGTKRAALESYLEAKKSAPISKGFGIDLDKFAGTTSQAPQYKVVNGVKYMRGPQGQAIPVK